MIFIGLDVSKISTALCVEKNYETLLYNYTSKKNNNIWIKETNNLINYRHIEYKYSDIDDYSKSELIKISEFDSITNLILNDILDNIDILDSVKIGIEGYSYNSKKGPIIDIVEFTSILKYKLINKLNKYSNIEILSPISVKSETCKMVYKPRIEIKGKRVIKEVLHNENSKGKEASKFDKWDMLYALIDSNIHLNLKDWCKENIDRISKNKEVPKPIDDIIDSVWIKEIIKYIK